MCENQNLMGRLLLQFCNLLQCFKSACCQEYRETFVTKFPLLPNGVRILISPAAYTTHD